MGNLDRIKKELETMIRVRKEKISNIKKVLQDSDISIDTRKQLKCELHRLDNELKTLGEARLRITAIYYDL